MIRIAVLGAGHWGPNLIRNLHAPPDSSVEWVVDSDPARLKLVRQRFPEVRLSRSAEEALNDPDVGAVAIATPSTTHYDLARRALERGKDVFVEKPLATSSLHARRLCDLARRRRRVLMVGHVFLYNPGVRYIKKLLEDGSAGRVQYISLVRTNLGPIRLDVNASWDLAAHDISVANYWAGRAPLAAAAHGGSWINRGVEDVAFITLRYPGSLLVGIHASWLNPRKVRDATVICERKMLTFDDMNPWEPVRVYDKHVSWHKSRVPFFESFASFRSGIVEGNVTIPKIQPVESLRLQCEHFVDCLGTRKSPLTDGEQGLDVVRALEAAERSMRRGGVEVALR